MVGGVILQTLWIILIVVGASLGALLLLSICFKLSIFNSLRFKPLATQSGELIKKKFFVCRDGYHLNWLGEINPQGQTILIGLHDLGMSREDFVSLRDYIYTKNPQISVVSYDQRNFGKNKIEEKRNAGSMIVDLQDLIVNLHEQYPAQKIVLIGEGLGFYLALKVAAIQPQVSKVIGVGLRNNRPYKNNWALKMNLLSGVLLSANKLVQIPGEGTDLSSNAIFSKKIDNHLFEKGEISVREYFQHSRLIRTGEQKLSQLNQPVLVLQGQKDIYVDVQKTGKMLDKTIESKFTIRYFPNKKHFLLNEPDNQEVLATILTWVE